MTLIIKILKLIFISIIALISVCIAPVYLIIMSVNMYSKNFAEKMLIDLLWNIKTPNGEISTRKKSSCCNASVVITTTEDEIVSFYCLKCKRKIEATEIK